MTLKQDLTPPYRRIHIYNDISLQDPDGLDIGQHDETALTANVFVQLIKKSLLSRNFLALDLSK